MCVCEVGWGADRHKDEKSQLTLSIYPNRIRRKPKRKTKCDLTEQTERFPRLKAHINEQCVLDSLSNQITFPTFKTGVLFGWLEIRHQTSNNFYETWSTGEILTGFGRNGKIHSIHGTCTSRHTILLRFTTTTKLPFHTTMSSCTTCMPNQCGFFFFWPKHVFRITCTVLITLKKYTRILKHCSDLKTKKHEKQDGTRSFNFCQTGQLISQSDLQTATGCMFSYSICFFQVPAYQSNFPENLSFVTQPTQIKNDTKSFMKTAFGNSNEMCANFVALSGRKHVNSEGKIFM